MTAKEIALKILALPEEQQNVPLIFSYYADSEDSVSCEAQISDIIFCQSSYPTTEPHIQLEEF
jgi:hypothetical protein